MNIAIITGHFPPSKGGGIAEWAFGVARELPRLGHKTSVYVTHRKNRDLSIHNDEEFKCKPMYGRNWHEFHRFYAAYYMWKILRKDPDTIFIATTWGMAKPFKFLKKYFPKSKMIVVAHGLEITRLNSKRELRAIRSVVESCDLILSVSRFTRDEIINRLSDINTSHVKFLPNGVDVERFYPCEVDDLFYKKYSLHKDSDLILTLARIIKRKAHDDVIKALPDIINDFPKAHYVIAGPHRKKDSYLESLKILVKELSLENNVTFIDFIPDEDLKKIYSASKVYIMPSKTLHNEGDSEGFGITFLEANACGCPAIGSYDGGIPDAVENEVNGLLVQSGSSNEIAKAIKKMFSDDDYRLSLAKKGIARVEESFTWKKLSAQMIDML
ncbi:MAG: glycosyltransferase family 4 protein [Candidatus Neomarinimicrobiota bacterium]